MFLADRFKESSKNVNRIPRTSQVFAAVMDAAQSEAKKVSVREATEVGLLLPM